MEKLHNKMAKSVSKTDIKIDSLFGTWAFGLQESGIRYERRQAPLWMYMNLRSEKCWCGKPKDQWDQFQRKYCCHKHAEWWFWYFRAYWNSFRMMIYRMFKFTCQKCDFKIKEKENDFMRSDWEVDHIIPISMDGMCYDLENIQLLCRKCHNKKTGEDLRKLKLKRNKQEILLPYISGEV